MTTEKEDYLPSTLALVSRAVRSWPGALMVLVAGLTVTALGTRLARQSYRSEASLLYRAGVGAGDPALQSDVDSPRQVTARLTELLTARARLETLIKELNLYPAIVAERGYPDAVDEMRKHLTFAAREGLSFRLSFDAESADVAQTVLDRVVASVIAEDGRLRREQAKDARKFFDTKKREIEDDLRVKEQALSQFLALHPELAVEAGVDSAKAGASVRGAERLRNRGDAAGRLALEMQAAQIESSIAEARRQAKASAAAAPAPNEPALRLEKAEQTYRERKAGLEEKQRTLTPLHPEVQKAERALAQAQADLQRVRQETSRWVMPEPARPAREDDGVANLERALQNVRNQIANLRRSEGGGISQPPGGAPRAAKVESEWARLADEANEARDRRDNLETRQFHATMLADLMEGGDGGRFVVVDAAYRPSRPVAGRRLKLAAAGGGGSLAAAMLTLMLLAFFDDRLYGTRDIRSLVGQAPAVVRVPGSLHRNG
jgi:hypothetical protein